MKFHLATPQREGLLLFHRDGFRAGAQTCLGASVGAVGALY